MGCVACRKLGLWRVPEIHHIVSGYRLGNDHTLPLCAWHHRGVPPDMDMYKSVAVKKLGPNLRDEKKRFVKEFGSEMNLLEEVNQWLDQNREGVEEIKAQPESESFLGS
jgi:hypothetical protein